MESHAECVRVEGDKVAKHKREGTEPGSNVKKYETKCQDLPIVPASRHPARQGLKDFAVTVVGWWLTKGEDVALLTWPNTG